MKFSKLDYSLMILATIVLILVIDMAMRLKTVAEPLEPRYKNKQAEEAYIPTKEEKAQSDKWIENLEKTHKEK